MEEWKEYKLGDILADKGYIRGPFGSALKRGDMKSEGIPVYEQQHAIYQMRDFRFFIDDKKFQEMKRFQVNENDLVISCSGTVGKVTIISKDDPKGIISQALLILRVNPNIILPKYLQYFFISSKGYNSIISRSSGSVQVNIAKRDVIESIPLSLPPLPTQQKIAAILSSLDDKIELNNKINTNLEHQAQALFKNWFVDFEPFGTEEKIESPIGTMIPRSLRMVQVADIPHLLETGKRPKGGAVAEGVPSIGAENVKQLGVFDFSSNKFIPREYADALGKGKINGYELLLYKDGGKPGTFIPHFSMFGEGFPYDECYINEHVFKLDFYDKGLNEFAYFYFNTEYVKNWLANNGGKAAIPGINQNDVNAIWIYDLENPKVKEFAKFIEPLFKQIFSNCKQNRELSTTRDTLLPKLMNGEIETNSNIISKE